MLSYSIAELLWTFSIMTSKRKNGGYSVGTFAQKIVKTKLIR